MAEKAAPSIAHDDDVCMMYDDDDDVCMMIMYDDDVDDLCMLALNPLKEDPQANGWIGLIGFGSA